MSYESAVAQLEQTNATLVQEVVRARDAIMGLNRMYATITEGRTAVKNGEYFTVPGSGMVYATLYKKTGSTTQQTVAEFPSRSAYDNLVTQANAATSTAQQAKNDVTTIKQKSPSILKRDLLRDSVEAKSGGGTIFGTQAKGSLVIFMYSQNTTLKTCPVGAVRMALARTPHSSKTK